MTTPAASSSNAPAYTTITGAVVSLCMIFFGPWLLAHTKTSQQDAECAIAGVVTLVLLIVGHIRHTATDATSVETTNNVINSLKTPKSQSTSHGH